MACGSLKPQHLALVRRLVSIASGIVFAAMERYWIRELEVIGNGVFGTKKMPFDELAGILKESSNRGRALRIAVTMELICD